MFIKNLVTTVGEKMTECDGPMSTGRTVPNYVCAKFHLKNLFKTCLKYAAYGQIPVRQI